MLPRPIESEIPNESINIDDPIARKVDIGINEFSTTQIKSAESLITTLSNAIAKSKGLTSYSDLSQIEILRDNTLSDGGGKKLLKLTLEITC